MNSFSTDFPSQKKNTKSRYISKSLQKTFTHSVDFSDQVANQSYRKCPIVLKLLLLAAFYCQAEANEFLVKSFSQRRKDDSHTVQ